MAYLPHRRVRFRRTLEVPDRPHGRQRGSILILTTLSLVLLLGMAGLALDLGHAYVNKTRLQNALDAVALSAAISLNRFNDVIVAENAGIATFGEFEAADGNSELTAIADEDLIFEFSDTLIPFTPGAVDPRFVRVRVDNFALQSWLVQVLGVDDKAVAAAAVSGPVPLQTVCNIAPLMVCVGTEADGSVDDDCSNGNCFGYNTETEIVLKTNARTARAADWNVGPGNFQLIRLEGARGGNDIRHALAGGYENCIEDGDTIRTEPGNTVGPTVQGINTRLGEYSGSPALAELYPPDLVSDIRAAGVVPSATAIFPQYLQAYADEAFDHPDGEPERRILAVPFGDCTTSIRGAGTLPLRGLGCFFLTRKTSQQGSKQEIYGELIDRCEAKGRPNPSAASLAGPYKIVLFKNPAGTDS